jgi:hypothetical protein
MLIHPQTQTLVKAFVRNQHPDATAVAALAAEVSATPAPAACGQPWASQPAIHPVLNELWPSDVAIRCQHATCLNHCMMHAT